MTGTMTSREEKIKVATGSGFELEVPKSYKLLMEKAEAEIEASLARYPKALKL